MSIKTSNQITFTEHKKIVEIKEWYLATKKASGVTNDLKEGWTLEVQTMNSTNKYLWNFEEVIYSIGDSEISDPVIIGVYGERGQDGNGVEYKYYLSNFSTAPTYSANNAQWTDDPTGVSVNQQYEYVVQIKTSNGTTIVSKPSLWAKFGEDGTDGRGISDVKNYYTTTSDASTVPSSWGTSVPELTPTNKYLWNYEVIFYTDGNTTETDPAIIGAYGDSGTDAVDFQIYSVDGFEFSDSLRSIELKTVALQAGTKLDDSKLNYQWQWWNGETSLYETISGATSSSLIVNDEDIYAFTGLKCEMTYDGVIYEDYVSLTKKTIVYTAVVKFFSGSNIIDVDSDYLIAYIDLYKNNTEEELVNVSETYSSNSNSVQNGIINTDISGAFANGDLMYFICQNSSTYDVVLGKYNSGTGKWQVVTNNYIYKNDIFTQTTSNVFIIPKNKIARSLNVNISVYRNVLDKDNNPICNSETIVARTNAIVMDLNDPIISATQPTNPQDGQLWLDTSVSPSILKMWNGTDWVNSGYQNGNVVYTSKPEDGYSKGDLWVLADGETCGDFGPGSMLRANNDFNGAFSESHWEDVDKELTEQKNNIKQYFVFNKDTGLKIGQSDDKFYVNISSTEMGFYDKSNGTEHKVVNISNQSATIQNAKLKGNTEFYGQINICEPTSNPEDNINDTLFIFKIESNGSLSLALAT